MPPPSPHPGYTPWPAFWQPLLGTGSHPCEGDAELCSPLPFQNSLLSLLCLLAFALGLQMRWITRAGQCIFPRGQDTANPRKRCWKKLKDTSPLWAHSQFGQRAEAPTHPLASQTAKQRARYGLSPTSRGVREQCRYAPALPPSHRLPAARCSQHTACSAARPTVPFPWLNYLQRQPSHLFAPSTPHISTGTVAFLHLIRFSSHCPTRLFQQPGDQHSPFPRGRYHRSLPRSWLATFEISPLFQLLATIYKSSPFGPS